MPQLNNLPLAERMRPEKFEELFGQEDILRPEGPLLGSLKRGRVFSAIFWGPPGSGKTTLARLIGKHSGYPYRTFSAVTSGIKDLKAVTEEAEKERTVSGKPTILFIDEIHRFNKAQQDALLPHVEKGLIILLGATTENPSFEVIPPLLSRVRVLPLKPLEDSSIREILLRTLADKDLGLGDLDIKIAPEVLDYIVSLSQGDARVALNNLETVVFNAPGAHDSSPLEIDLKGALNALTKKRLPYDKDGEEHYNLISAFHKSLRGSDAQASLYWLYRMLLAGEDPLFIARRMIRCASEDVGLADPKALEASVAAFDAWQRVGPPEAELALAQAAVYLASAPKSNALYLAEKAVKKEIDDSGALPVPLHIRNAPTSLMKKLGYSRGYLYPHNYREGWVKQEYLPDRLKNRTFYKPTARGFEVEMRKRLARKKQEEG